MGAFRYLRPDKNVLLDALVTGSVASDYQASWLCDGRPGFPVLGPGADVSPQTGGLSLSIASTLGDVDFIAATHLRLDDDVPITIGGDISTTLVGRGDQADDIPLNRWKLLPGVSPAVSVDNLTVTVVSNSTPPVIGELFAGVSDTLPRRLRIGAVRTDQLFAISADSQFSSVNDYDPGLDGTILQGTQTFRETELDEIFQWRKSCRNGSRLTVIVPDDDKDECLVVKFVGLTITDGSGTLKDLTFTFQEIPRQRW